MTTPAPKGDTRVLPRLAWIQPFDSAVYDSTKSVLVVLFSGKDTLYKQRVDFSLHGITIPGSVSGGSRFTLEIIGDDSRGSILWYGEKTFTASGDTMTVDIPAQMGLSKYTVTGSVSPFSNWYFRDTSAVSSTIDYIEYEKINLASDSSYSSNTWGIYRSEKASDTVFYATEEGRYSFVPTTSSSSSESGAVTFAVTRYAQCMDTTSQNLCGNGTFARHMTAVVDTTLLGAYHLSSDSLVLVESGQTFRFSKK